MRTSLLFLLSLLVSASACGVGQSACGSACYTPSQNQYTCTTDNKGSVILCPSGSPSACNAGCYDPNSYSCTPNGLVPRTVTPSTYNAASTSNPATTSNAAVTSTMAVTSNAVAPSTSACAGCGSSPCCGSSCYDPTKYGCPTDVFSGKPVLCMLGLSACNMACFDSNTYVCNSGSLQQKSAATSSQTPSPNPTSSAAAPTSAAAASTTATPVVVNPAPAPVSFPTQTADLRIINSCKKTLWFEARYGGQGAPIPGQSVTAVQALPGSYVDYTVPATGLSGSRFWAKYGCDVNGKNCLIGDQMQYWPNPPGGCPAAGCTPPVDSLFEATWGCKPGQACNGVNPTTWFDTSQVDGWTIPYKLTASGALNQCDCIGTSCGFTGVDATALSLANCPRGEDLSMGGQYPSANVAGYNVPLNSVDLRIINNASEVIGCMSPCKKLNWGAPYGLQQGESSGTTMWMCCPTPTPSNCSPSNGCISPTACRGGPIVNTQYVAAVHKGAPGVYSYSYDDGVGLHACPAGTVIYTMEFCPNGSTYPLQL